MTDYVLDLGIVAFISWWQFAWWLSIVAMYIMANVCPAMFMLFYPPHRWTDIFVNIEAFLFLLLPIFGTLFGCCILEDWKPFRIAFRMAFLIYVISFFGMII